MKFKNRIAQNLPQSSIVMVILVILVLIVIAALLTTNLNKCGKQFDDVSNSYATFNGELTISKTDLENEHTLITIEVKKGENLIVENFIPKEVIPILTEENKEEFIQSDRSYIILEEDPLIAWSVEKAPTQINYTIKKKISKEDFNNFKVSASKKDSSLKYVTYLAYIVIAVILFSIVKPIFNKKRKSKR